MAKKNLQLVQNEQNEKSPSNGLKMRLEDLVTISAKTENQGQFMSQYRHKPAFLLHGCAGTGKTFIALYRALEEVLDKQNGYGKVVIVRSAVPSRDIGHLPGSEEEKTEVYSAPYQAMCEELFPTKDKPYQRLVEQKYLEFMCTSYVRGITLDHAVVIVDECQNLNFHELDTITTRVGQDSKIVFCGDFSQTDLLKQNEKNGLHDFLRILEEMQEFNCVEFNIGDIVRSGFVRNYLIQKTKLGMGLE